MNSAESNVKLKGQMNSEFDEFVIHGKKLAILIRKKIISVAIRGRII